MTKALEWKPLTMWATSDKTQTFTITEEGQKYYASVNRLGGGDLRMLGTHFRSVEEAMGACERARI